MKKSYFRFLPVGDKEVLADALKGNNEIDDDVYDTLSSLDSYRAPATANELKSLIVELARRDILMRPSYMREAFEDVLAGQKVVANVRKLSAIYRSGVPTGKKILKLLSADPENDREAEVYKYLTEFIRTLKKEDIPLFMRYVTGADMMCVGKISVIFTRVSTGERKIVAHTCGPVLDVPSTYESYPQFREEFLNLLKCGYWSMDII